MKLINSKLTQTLKPLCLALLLGLSASVTIAAEIMPADDMQNTTVIDPESAVLNTMPETYNNDTWQAPIVIEFNKLDSTGNGLLMPNEASKGKAFNKVTFKQADTDNDGSVDINEYIFFKTGKVPETAKPEPVVQTKPCTFAVPKVPMMNEANYFM